MPLWLKIVLAAVAALVILVVAVGFGAYWYFTSHKDELMAMGKKAREEAESFAVGKDASQCVDESLRRAAACDGFICEGGVQIFLDACTEKAAASPELCTSAPPADEIMRSAQWSLDECKRRGYAESQRCSNILQRVQKYCAKGPKATSTAAP